MRTTHDNRIRPTRGARADLEATKPSARQYTDDTDIDAPRWLLAGLMNGTDCQALALQRHLKPDDLDVPDGIIYKTVLEVAADGQSPTPVLVHGRLAADGVFGRHQGDRVKSRMLEASTVSGHPEQAREIALVIVDRALRRRVLAASEGLARAAGDLPSRDLFDYMVEQGRAVRALDERRIGLGGDAA